MRYVLPPKQAGRPGQHCCVGMLTVASRGYEQDASCAHGLNVLLLKVVRVVGAIRSCDHAHAGLRG